MSVVTRFPPSPTGFLHIGRARTALFNYLFTQNSHGKMVFRIEDTDKERSKREYEQDIIDCLQWLGIKYDSGPFRQSEREEVYKNYLKKMIADGTAYVSKEPSEKNPTEIVEVVRFKNPNKRITFTDLIRGEITFDTTELKDFVVARNINEPLYHLAVVVDDHEMGVTHIIRGEDGISNTPRQILIQEAIGAKRPLYAHIPLILATDKSKLSGRHGAVSVNEYRKQGYLPEAIVNFLALLGWNPGGDKEIFRKDELIKLFSLEKIQKSGAVFNLEKLNWFNKQYLNMMSDSEFVEAAKPWIPGSLTAATFSNALKLVRDKIQTFAEIEGLFGEKGELNFLRDLPEYDPAKLVWKKDSDVKKTIAHLEKIKSELSLLDSENFSAEQIKAAIWNYAEAGGKGAVLWPFRYSLTGQEKSPDPFISASLLGKEKTIERLDMAVEKLKK